MRSSPLVAENSAPNSPNDYRDADYAQAYLAAADSIPHRAEGENVLLSFVPPEAQRILDLGTGDGRLISLLLPHCQDATAVGLDGSSTMVEAARHRFRQNPRVEILLHDLEEPLPDLGSFDVIVSSFAIHHCRDGRKRTLYREIFDSLVPGGVFCNLEHIAPLTENLHLRFLDALGATTDDEDSGNILLALDTQLTWLREIGFVDVDCYWKWLELALFGGYRPAGSD